MATLSFFLRSLFLASCCAHFLAPASRGQDQAPAPPGIAAEDAGRWRLTWRDEFDGSTLDETKWSYRGTGWREHAQVVPEGVTLDGHGLLHLWVKEKEGVLQNAMIGTQGKFSARFGIMAARTRFPRGQGQHGSFWMQPAHSERVPDDAGRSGAEIDIIEWFGAGRKDGGTAANVYWPSLSGKLNRRGKMVDLHHFLKPGETWSDDFHVYSVEWSPEGYVFRVDDHEMQRVTEGVSLQPQFLILSLLSSDWELPQLDRAQLPNSMDVDWVRVWQNDHAPPMPVNAADSTMPFHYPTTRRDDTVDDYHGTKVADPYRWLEDDNSPETAAWVAAENKVTFGYLETIPERTEIHQRIRTLFNYERYGTPLTKGGRYFYTYNSGLQNQRVLMVAETLNETPRALLDPNALAKDGTASLAGYSVSEDGKLLAYGLQHAGSDWEEWHVRDVDTGADRADALHWVKFSGASWAHDGSGFYYSRFDAPREGAQLTGVNEFQKLCFHRLGQAQAEDTLVYERKDHKDWGFEGHTTEDGRYMLITVIKGTDPKNAVFYLDLQDPAGKVVELLPLFDAQYDYIANDGPLFFFNTDRAAPRGRVVGIDLTQPAEEKWAEIIPQAAEPLKEVSLIGQRFLCSYLKDARSAVKVYDHQGAAPARLAGELALPGLGTASGFAGERKDRETFFSFTSFTVPGSVYRVDLETLRLEVFREPKVDFHPADYETRQVFYPSADGTRIPMFITAKRGVKLDGQNPTILYGYGGFNISLTPSFHVPNVAWLERGGVFAEANLRGGGEYGIEWHNAGIRDRKQNVFDDFIAAAEYLVREKYTSPARLGITGGSNGGLLVGACLAQRPDLFAAAAPAVGVMDMLRFHRFTIGWAWASDYGSSDQAEDFRYLYAYSPLHHLRKGCRYPATFIMTSDHDDRVVPAHSFKFAARLQECQAADGPPVLIRIQTDAGHGGGTALTKVIDSSADELSFLWHELAR